MCLAVPGKVVRWLEREPPFARAEVEFGGVRRPVSMDFLPEAVEGDYVIVHAGVAISRLDPDEAAQVLETLEELELAALDEAGGENPAVDPGDDGAGS
jgi:hydrogenase expression/formation protein HypC